MIKKGVYTWWGIVTILLCGCIVWLVFLNLDYYNLGAKYNRQKAHKDSLSNVKPFPNFLKEDSQKLISTHFKNDSLKLSKEEFNELQQWIQFYNDKIDKTVDFEKDEINNDISRLNMWVTLWCVILALGGVLAPAFYTNLGERKMESFITQKNKEMETTIDTKISAVTENIGAVTENANEANNKVNAATEKIETLNGSISALSTQYDNASRTANNALKIARVTNAIHSLSSMVTHNINFGNQANSVLYIKNKIKRIIIDFNLLIENHNDIDFEIILPDFIDFSFTLRLIMTHFEDVNISQAINNFSVDLNGILSNGLNRESIGLIITGLGTLVNTLAV